MHRKAVIATLSWRSIPQRQGGQGEPNVETLHFPFTAQISRHCMISSGNQHQPLSCNQSKEMKIIHTREWKPNVQSSRYSQTLCHCAATALEDIYIANKTNTNPYSTYQWARRTAAPEWLRDCGRTETVCRCRRARACSTSCRSLSLWWTNCLAPSAGCFPGKYIVLLYFLDFLFFLYVYNQFICL